jgi:hypothetical protein
MEFWPTGWCFDDNGLPAFRPRDVLARNAFFFDFAKAKVTSPNNQHKEISMQNESSSELRIRDNPHFARVLRQRLESRHPHGAVRETLAQMTDAELIAMYLKNEQQGRDHLAKTRVQKLLARAEKQSVSE